MSRSFRVLPRGWNLQFQQVNRTVTGRAPSSSYQVTSRRPFRCRLDSRHVNARTRKHGSDHPDGPDSLTIITVTLAAHGRLDPVAVEDPAVRPAGVLGATIGMVDKAPGWSAMLDRHHQRVLTQRTPRMVGHAPADDLACRHVLDSSQVNQRSSVAMYVISASQIVFVFGRSDSKARWRRFGAMP